MAALSISQISTFVFVDLEATGLAGIGEKPRITELCLVAVQRSSLLEKSAKNTPRVLNKLTLCFNPEKAIGHEASSITGLYNDALSLQGSFNESVVDICNLFFEQLPLPICLLAHNGHKYDFPLLAAELLRTGRHFHEDILCADTLDGFRDVLSFPDVQDKILKPHARVPSPIPGVSAFASASMRTQTWAVNKPLFCTKESDQPSNATPEMQVVKSNINFSNAPKKKPLPADQPKSVRVSSAKRKLEFGPSTSELAKNEVDDVDREDVLDSIHGYHLTPNGSRTGKRDENENLAFKSGQLDAQDNVVISGSQGFQLAENPASLWEEFINEDEVPDDVLIEAVDHIEQTLLKSKCASDNPLGFTPNAPTKTWANVVQDSKRKVVEKEVLKQKDSVCSPQPSCSKDDKPSSGLSEKPAGNNSVTVSLSPAASNKSNPEGDQRTPTSNGVEILDSFPTPSPSPHKDKDIDQRVLSSTLSPLASPFVPQSFKSSPGYNHQFGAPTQRGNPLGISLALSSLHKRVLGYGPEDSHRAEDDCMSLLRLSNKLSPWFCDWVDHHASLFKSTAPMYKSSKRARKP